MLEQLINQNKVFKVFTGFSPWADRHQGMLFNCLYALLHKYLWFLPEGSSNIDPILLERIGYLSDNCMEAKRLTAYRNWLKGIRYAYNTGKLSEKYYPFRYKEWKSVMEK